MVRLMVVADIRLYREGLKRLLEPVEDIDVVGSAGSGDQALDRLKILTPDTLLVDRAVPGSLRLVSKVRAADADLKVVILTIEEVEDEIIRCVEAGVDGYVTRNATAAELVETIRAARAGELRCSPSAAGSLLRRVKHLSAKRQPLEVLTDRELEVLTCVERGLSNRRISESLGIEVATVKNHVHNILDKLQVQGRGEAAAVFRRNQGGFRSAREI
jgi:DNA-binding NarL/FixJ family response regulator